MPALGLMLWLESNPSKERDTRFRKVLVHGFFALFRENDHLAVFFCSLEMSMVKNREKGPDIWGDDS